MTNKNKLRGKGTILGSQPKGTAHPSSDALAAVAGGIASAVKTQAPEIAKPTREVSSHFNEPNLDTFSETEPRLS